MPSFYAKPAWLATVLLDSFPAFTPISDVAPARTLSQPATPISFREQTHEPVRSRAIRATSWVANRDQNPARRSSRWSNAGAQRGRASS